MIHIMTYQPCYEPHTALLLINAVFIRISRRYTASTFSRTA